MDELKLSNEELEEEIEKKSTSKKIIVVLILLLAIAAVCYYLFFMTDNNKLSAVQENTGQNVSSASGQNTSGGASGDTSNNPFAALGKLNTSAENTANIEQQNAAQNNQENKQTQVSGQLADSQGNTQGNAQGNTQVNTQTNNQINAQNTNSQPNEQNQVKPEDNLAVIPASEAAKVTQNETPPPPPPLFTEKKNTLANELLATQTNPVTNTGASQEQSSAQGEELRQSINNDQLGLGEFLKQQDSVVSIFFIDNFAKWLVDSYQPAKNDGVGKTSAGIKSANLRYGTNLTGLNYIEANSSDGRKSILRYVYSPGMLDALYRLYVTRFLDAMAFASQERKPALSPAQVEDMYKIYANYLNAVGSVLLALGQNPELVENVARYHQANVTMVNSNNIFSNILHKYEQEEVSPNEAAKLKADLDTAGKNYEIAVTNRDRIKAELITQIKAKSPNVKLNDDTILFMALWVDRRVQENPNAYEATQKAAELCFDLAKRF